MKRIIFVLTIFALVVSIGVFELHYSTSAYKQIYNGLEKVSISIDQNKGNLDNQETIELMESVLNRWNKSKNVLFMFGHTTLLRSIDERLVSLDVMIKTNHKDDAPVFAATTKALIRAVLNDTHPNATNLL
ncbi:MAG: DUF4363 family protein [Firmicutes bacterium]|nr:DUF4363 family protein [Bacillota bacterium]